MKAGVWALFVALSLSSCYEQERNCKDFQTGEFEFELEIEGQMQKTRFIRTMEYEVDFYGGKTDTSDIRWVSDCEYVLTKRHPKNRAEAKPITMKILSTQGDTYQFEFGIVGSSAPQRGTVKKIN